MFHHLVNVLQLLHPLHHALQKKCMHSFHLIKVSNILVHHLGAQHNVIHRSPSSLANQFA